MAANASCDSSGPPGICAHSLRERGGAAGFLETVVRYCDGSRWKLVRAVSEPKYQQGGPPFEARQVFEAVCIEDSHGAYSGIGGAIVKVEYH